MLDINITPESWRRFQMHAQRVRVLHDKDWSTVHSSTWAFIARWCGADPLLPNLEELSGLPLNLRSPTTLMFISPKLRILSVLLTTDHDGRGRRPLVQGDPATVHVLLMQIASTAPGIASLTIANHLSLTSPCYYALDAFENIEELDVRDCVLNFHLLWTLGTRPLRSFAATVDMTDLPSPPTGSGDEDEEYDPFEGCFLTLKHLTVRETPENIDLFLYHTTTCALETIALEFTSGANQELVTRCIENIPDDALLARPSVLRSLAIKYPYESHYDDEHPSGNAAAHTLRGASLPDVIRPALRIPSLRKVTLDFHNVPALTDAGILQMIDAWPRLTALHIAPPQERYESRYVKLTPAVLVAFAQQCPRLSELTLPEVPLHDVPAEKDMPLVGQRALRRLRVSFRDPDRGGESVLYKAALFIDRLFPCLALDPAFAEEVEEPRGHGAFKTSWELKEAREEEKTWRRIEEFLYVMQLGRRHCEERGSANMGH